MGLQIGSRASSPAGAKILKLAGDLAPPFRLDGHVFLSGGGHAARSRRTSGATQRGVTETANIGRIAVNGAAILTSFYHRSVLRCGCLAERKSGVEDILTAAGAAEEKWFGLSRNGYPGQPHAFESNL